MTTKSVKQIHQQIVEKLDIFVASTQVNNKLPIDIINEIHTVNSNYRINSSHYILEWIQCTDTDLHSRILDKYEGYLNTEKIISTLDYFASQIFGTHLNNNLLSLYHQYKRTKVKIASYKECDSKCDDCHVEMEVRKEYSDMKCPDCGLIQILEGTTFENNESTQKNGPYKPTGHCNFHVECIFAMESNEIPQNIIDKIKDMMKRDQIPPTSILTCKKIREYLKILKLTNKYNSHVPKIRYLITNIQPHKPTADELNMISDLFELSDRIFMKIKPTYIQSRQYYPHRIRKIVEIVYKDKLKIRNSIIQSIHLQGDKTTCEHDTLWKMICNDEEAEDKLPFIKTQKHVMRY